MEEQEPDLLEVGATVRIALHRREGRTIFGGVATVTAVNKHERWYDVRYASGGHDSRIGATHAKVFAIGH